MNEWINKFSFILPLPSPCFCLWLGIKPWQLYAIEKQNSIPCWPPGFLSSLHWQGGSARLSGPHVWSRHPPQRVSVAGRESKTKKNLAILLTVSKTSVRGSLPKRWLVPSELDCVIAYSSTVKYTLWKYHAALLLSLSWNKTLLWFYVYICNHLFTQWFQL